MRTFTIIFLLFSISLTSQANTVTATFDGIYCEGKLYTLDYISLENEQPFTPQFKPDEIHPINQRFGYSIAMNAMIQKFAQELTPTYNTHLSAFLNSYGNTAWQRNDRGFLSKIVQGSSYNIPTRCRNDKGEVELLTLAVLSKQGDLIAIEYDPNLIEELKKDGLQLSYLLMGTYLRNITQNQKSISVVNWLFHAKTTIVIDSFKVRQILVNTGILKPASDSNYCNLGLPLQQALMDELKLPCEEQTNEDILSLRTLNITADEPEASYSILKNDFMDFSNLEHLSLSNFGESIGRISYQNYQALRSLKSFSISNSYLNHVPDELMYGLKNLVKLNLSGNDIYDIKAGTFEHIIIPLAHAPEKVSINLSNNPSLSKTNQYGFIGPGAFRGAEAVTHLNLSKMSLKSIKSQVFDNFKRLKVLDISKNYIKKMKGMLDSKGLSTVTHLNMEGMSIRRIGKSDFTHLKSIEELKISHARIKEFPFFLAEIKTLKKLTFCSRYLSNEKMKNIKIKLQQLNPNLNLTICENN